MFTRFSGFLIGSFFGLVFVLVNVGPPLSPALIWGIRVLAVTMAAAVIVLIILISRRESTQNAQPPSDAEPEEPRFGPFFGVVVLIEFALIFAGATLIGRLGLPPETGVAWVALVVGLHFFPLAWKWRQRELVFVAWYATVLGAIGLALVAAGLPAWAPLVSGVVTGCGMLLGCLLGIVPLYRRALAPSEA
ncbi:MULTISPECIES: hypothetical protein [Nocardiopsis]|uniref:Uncharacterized protein n=2 Tax=Nocardiopsis alba TaxID=53437 RepID=A0A7K2ITD7_9ACTN|nr:MULTISPECIES: hypothetical protein [Nocardiopsis]MEC3893517.1 hypothetical protein [Nocardiopsis sp. LDBS1602]MYR33117.1 hypothetical protein [Nocardiopsis alba]